MSAGVPPSVCAVSLARDVANHPWRRLCVGTLAAVASLLVTAPSAASAQLATLHDASGGLTQAQPAESQALEILDQSIWITPGQPVSVQVKVTSAAPPSDQSLAVIVYPRLRNLSDYDRAVDDDVRGSALGLSVARLDQLTGSKTGTGVSYQLELPTQGPGESADRSKLALATAGVYPIRVELRNDDGVAFERQVSFVMSTGRTTPAPTPVFLTIPLTRSSATSDVLTADIRQADTTDDDAESTLVAERISVLGKHPNTEFSLLIGGGAVDSIGQTDQTLLTDLRAYLGAQPVKTLRAPYVDIAPELFSSSSYDVELATQLLATDAAMPALMGEQVTTSTTTNNDVTVVPNGARSATITAMAQSDDVLLVEDDQLANVTAPTRGSTTPNDLVRRPRVEVALSDGTTRAAVVANSRARTAHSQPIESVVKVAWSIAALVQPALVNGTRSDVAAPILAFNADLTVDAPTLDRQLKELRNSGWLALTTDLSDVGDAASTDNTTTSTDQVELIRDQQLRTQGSSDQVISAGNVLSSQIVAVRQAQNAYATFSNRFQPVTQQTDRLLWWSAASNLAADTRLQLLDAVSTQINAEFASVTLPPDRPVRLTARTGAIPITVQSNAPYDTQVLIRIRSNQLQFPEGNERLVTVSKDNRTETFEVVARGSGAFPLEIDVLTPDGTRVLASSDTVIRSTAASGVGIALSGAALAVLAFWWSRQVLDARRRRIRADRETASDEPAASSTPTSRR